MGHSGAAEVSVRHRLAWDFDEQSQSFELAAEPGGCRLTFVTTVDDLPVAQTATGWHTYLSRLEPHLAGGVVSEDDAHTSWRAIHEG
ncbi:MAG: hypothetical protein HOQ24_14840, partial [Mycobacteriaceae bacterium]|nr:hypothetical protein [Mycobacteriaceae bacterium]